MILGKTYRFLLLLLLTLGLGSCRGYYDEPIPEPATLSISSDKTEILASGKDIVRFSAKYGEMDVTGETSFNLIYVYNGGEAVNMSAKQTIFATSKAGVYVFSAVYIDPDGIKHESINKISITAKEAEASKTEYGRKVLGMQFTSVGCQNCPILSTYIKELKSEYGNRIAMAAFHANYGTYTDPMAEIGGSAQFSTETMMQGYGFNGLPHFVLDMDKNLQSGAFKDKIRSLIDGRLNEPSTCGVAINTEYDSEKSQLIVHSHFTSTEEKSYRYVVYLVEDGIRYFQLNGGDDYVHNNVVRAVLTLSTQDKVNRGNPLKSGQQYTESRAIRIASNADLSKFRVITAVLSSTDDVNYSCENVNECVAGESVGYYIKGQNPGGYDGPVESLPAFRRHLAFFEFTGQWCSNCPTGYKILYSAVAAKDSDYKDISHIIALHDNSGGKDDFAEPLQEVQSEMFREFQKKENGGIEGYPAVAVDLREGITLVAGVRNDIDAAIRRSLEEYPAQCGVSVKSDYDASTGKAEIQAKLYSLKKDTYRIAVFVIEDGLKGAQKDGGIDDANYTHNHVARAMLSESYRGDSIGEIGQGKEQSKIYTLDVDPKWNPAKTKICVLAIDSNGYVNNVAVCALDGGNTDYDYLK